MYLSYALISFFRTVSSKFFNAPVRLVSIEELLPRHLCCILSRFYCIGYRLYNVIAIELEELRILSAAPDDPLISFCLALLWTF